MEQAGEIYGFNTQPRQQWYALEKSVKGDPKLATVERMCVVLACSIVDILADDSPAMPARRRKAVEAVAAQNRSTPSGSAGS